MTPLIAAVAGSLIAGGLVTIAAGLRRTTSPRAILRRRPRRPRPDATPGGRWARWRWLVAAASGLLAWAVSGWLVVGVTVGATVVGLPILLGTSKAAADRIDRAEAIEEWTRRLADVLSTGVGLEQAVVASARSCPTQLRSEISALVARFSARWPTEEALRAFADDVDDAAADLVVASLLLAARRRGPGLASMLTAVAGSVADEVSVRRKIEAERARPRATARAVTLITFGVAGVGALNGTYLAPYGDPLGQVALTVIVAAFVACLVWMRRLTLSAPDPRFLTGLRERASAS
jgi:Flp pilus assembly protein TadB